MTSTYIWNGPSGGGDLGQYEQKMFQILWTFYNTKQLGTRVKILGRCDSTDWYKLHLCGNYLT